MKANNNSIGIFKECKFLNESFTGAVAELLVFSALAGVMVLVKRHKDKQKNEQEKKRLEKVLKESRKAKRDKFIQDCKKFYGITDLQRTNDIFKTDEDLYDDMEKRGNVWLSKILNSKVFAENVNAILADEEKVEYLSYDNSTFKPTLSYFKSIFKIGIGVNGYDESMQIIDGSQDECIEFNWVVYDLAEMFEIVYGINIGCGDGDEGHIYYDLKNYKYTK